ncbi:MAG: ComEC/Rec2 family competence protein [Chlorobi bacterium]|nr:ComEC/Rec2 family competence protein [Chlorobiota bacterium]
MQWSVRPFVRIVIFYVSGIIIGNNFNYLDISIEPALLVFATLLLINALLSKFFTSYKNRWLTGLVFYCMISLAAAINIYFTNKPIYQAPIFNEDKVFIAEVLSDIRETSKTFRAELLLKYEDSLNNIQKEKVIAYLEKSPDAASLGYGDKISIIAKPLVFGNKGNPAEFDYKTYLLHRGIAKSLYLKKSQWVFLGHNPTNKLISYARLLRLKLLEKLREYLFFKDTYPVAAAILVGYDSMMDDETQDDYIKAGAMHILCVSGLHVGVIFLLMTQILNFLLRWKYGRLIRIVLLLLSIWAYALLTGMSPSVERSAIMFSFFIVGQGLRRPKDSYNTLAASAFVMLAINPNLLFSVGFQLSYSAVLGIIALYKPLYKLLYFRNIFLNYLWSILSVSIAAQLATFPIASHYFHYFANYFWLINLIVIPASFAIIVSGFVFFIFSGIPFLAGALGALTSFFVLAINYVVSFVEYFPYYGLENIFMPWWKTFLIYLIIAFGFHILFFKRIRLLIYLAAVLFILSGINTIYVFNNLKASKVICYNINNHDIILLKTGPKSVILSDKDFINDNKLQQFALKNSLIEEGIKTKKLLVLGQDKYSDEHTLFIDRNFFQFKDKRFLIVENQGDTKMIKHSNNINVDYLMVLGKRNLDIKSILYDISFKKLIIGSTVPIWKQQKIIAQCTELGLNYYSLKQNGAFVEEIK